MFCKQQDYSGWIKDFIGIEFQDVGREKLCDCWGLVRRVFFEKYKIEIPRYDEYESTKELEKLDELIKKGKSANEWTEILEGKEQKGDVVLFKIRGHLCHVGLCLDNDYMLHIQKGKNACIECYGNLKWRGRVHSFYRHEKFAEE